MKSTSARTTTIASVSPAMYGSGERRPAMENVFQAVKSICAGTINLFHRVYLGQTSFETVISKLRNFFSDEPFHSAIVSHFKVVWTLNRCGARALIRRDRYYVNKYMRNYLATSFSKAQRREILLFHHRYLTQKQITESFYEKILEKEQNLWCEIIDENKYAIRMTFLPLHDEEGDISLIFSMNDRELYGISFSIVPGKMIGSSADQAVLIGNIQGKSGEAEAIRIGTKACHDITPPYLLLAAASSIADVLAVKTIAGVGNERQLKATDGVSGCYFDYDTFWKTLSLTKNSADFYEGSVPLPEKPIELIKSKNRGRARLKRRFRQQVFERVGTAFAKFIAKTANRNHFAHACVEFSLNRIWPPAIVLFGLVLSAIWLCFLGYAFAELIDEIIPL